METGREGSTPSPPPSEGAADDAPRAAPAAPLDYSLKFHASREPPPLSPPSYTPEDPNPGSPDIPQARNGAPNGQAGPTHGDMADGGSTTPVKLPPGLPPLGLVNPALLGLQPGLPMPIVNPLLCPTGKPSRPFKQYPKDGLQLPLGYLGLPGLLAPGMAPLGPTGDPAQAGLPNTEELFKRYREYMTQMLQGQAPPAPPPAAPPGGGHRRNGDPDHLDQGQGHPHQQQELGHHSPDDPVSSPETPSPPHHVTSPSLNPGQNGVSPPSSADNLTPPSGMAVAMATTPTSTSSRKRGRTTADADKTESYYERRRKNNEAAKRSRDARRAKEDEIAIRAAFLEQENLKLRVEVASLKNETAKLRCMLYNS